MIDGVVLHKQRLMNGELAFGMNIISNLNDYGGSIVDDSPLARRLQEHGSPQLALSQSSWSIVRHTILDTPGDVSVLICIADYNIHDEVVYVRGLWPLSYADIQQGMSAALESAKAREGRKYESDS